MSYLFNLQFVSYMFISRIHLIQVCKCSTKLKLGIDKSGNKPKLKYNIFEIID